MTQELGKGLVGDSSIQCTVTELRFRVQEGFVYMPSVLVGRLEGWAQLGPCPTYVISEPHYVPR